MRHKLLPPVLTALIVVGAMFAPTAPASVSAPYDGAYARGGALLFPDLLKNRDETVDSCEILPGGRLAVAGRFGDRQYATNHEPKLGVAIVRRFEHAKHVSARAWKLLKVPDKQTVVAQDFAADGSFAYVTANKKGGRLLSAHLFRVRADGRADRRFDGDGQITVDPIWKAGARQNSLDVTALSSGAVVVGSFDAAGSAIARYKRDGSLDPSWATNGVFSVAGSTAINGWAPILRSGTILESGSALLVSASDGAQPATARRVGLLKLNAAGAIDATFGINGLWLPPSPSSVSTAGTAYSQPGQLVRASVGADGVIAIAYADLADVGTGTSFDYRLASVDANGVTTATSPVVGSYFNGGDDGFPDRHPVEVGATRAGVTFAAAETYYSSGPGSYRGFAIGWWGDPSSVNAKIPINGGAPFVTDSFAPSPSGQYMYACGSYGGSGSKGKPPWQRKRVAVARIRLF